MKQQPDYVSFEPNAREELLSQIGSFSPLERTLFQRLCESWAPVIDRNRFISRVGGSEQEVNALDRLMSKLRASELGLVTTSLIDEKRVPTGIVLTSKGDLRFHMTLLDEETRKLTDTGYRVLPSIPRLTQRKAVPPDHLVSEADSVTLAETYLADTPEDGILRVRLLGEYRILTSSHRVKELIASSLKWLRTSLEERGFIEEVARVKNSGIMELKQQLSTKTPDFWLDLTRTIVQERSTIAFRKNVQEDDELFQAAYLIMTFTDARVGAAKARKEDDTRVDDELKLLARSVEEAPGGKMDAEEFSRLASEAGERLGKAQAAFSRRLEADLMTPRPRRRLPVITSLAGVYIHRNRVRNVFESSRTLAAERLREEYTDLMEAFLRGRSPEIGETFASKGDLDQDMRGRVERQDPVLGQLMLHPQLLAEAVIRHSKLLNDATTTDEVKRDLAAYFNVQASELLPPHELFAIDLVPVFDAAFARLNVFRQLLLRISGRHESLRRNYLRRFGPGRKRISYADEGGPVAPGGGRTRTEKSDVPGVRTQGTGNRDYEPETVKPGRRVKPSPQKPRVKSPREVDRAWRDFDEALHTKSTDLEDDFS